MNRKVCYFFLLLTTISNLTVTNAHANSETTAQDRCSETTQSVVKEIGSFGTPVYLWSDNNANRYHTGNPTDRQRDLSIILGNLRSSEPEIYTLAYPFNSKQPKKVYQTVSNILNSPALQQKWSNSLVKSCPDLAVVGYSLANSDWVVEYAIQENETTKRRDCVDYDILDRASNSRPMSWNTRRCL
jgi:hypothetical protein